MFSQNQLLQHFLPIVVFLQVIMYITLFLNLPVAMQVVGIIYLSFIPGVIFVKLIKLENLRALEFMLFSVGFSIAFLMIAGLIINEFGSTIGLSFPLSTLPLSLFINTLIIIGAAAVHLRQPKVGKLPSLSQPKFSPALLLLILIPVLSIVGALFVNITGNNSILLIMISAIAVVFAVGAFYERSVGFYAFAILMIALALLFHTSLISSHILPYGGDSPLELYVFSETQQSAHWNATFAFPTDQGYGRFNAMLSITILPTVYANMLGMDPTWVYKIIFPAILALVPVALYVLWQPYIGKKFAFLAAFLFMAQSTFFTEMISLGRQSIAELFFILLLILLLNKQVKRESKFVGFAILSFGLIVSHYALAQIFLFLIITAWSVSVFYLKKPSFNLQLTMIIFFFVAMFGWYIYTSGSVVFDSIMTFTRYVATQLGDFFDPASRGTTVLTGLGLTQSPSFLNTISRAFAYLTELFIIVGVIALVRRKTKVQFGRDYTVFSLVAVAFLVVLTIVPGLANTLSMTRFYHILLMFLAPFCIIGIWAFAKYVLKNDKKLVVSFLVVVVLIPYFLFQTNFVYEVAKSDSWSVSLSGYRMNPMRLYGDDGYIDSYSVYGAQWVSNNVPYQWNIAGDNGLFTSLTAYGLIYRGYITGLDNTTILRPGQYVYLSYISICYEPLSSNGSLPRVLNQTNVIYSNGGSEVLCTPLS
ncbi:MAG: DUF2206 domain-containing protein [Candidatus Bathyarchaeota archaeon]|nr:DUF2206 domain-containing protein [Candidatus Bathyarchaeota archaeon]